MPLSLALPLHQGGLPLSNVSLPPWKEVKNRIDGATPSVYADFGRDKYALANVGPNLVANGDFKSGLGDWTVVSGTASAANGVARISGDGSGGRISYALTGLVVGRVYSITFDFVTMNGTNVVYAVSPNFSSTATNADVAASTSALGPRQFLFVATGTTRNVLIAIGNTALGNYADVGPVIVREITSTLGPNLVRNGDFATDLAGWTDASTAPAAMSWSGGQAVTTADGVNLARLRQTIATVPGRTYVFSHTGTAPIGVGTSVGGQELLVLRSNLSRTFTATTTTTYLSMFTANNGQTLDNVSVREVLVGLGPEIVTNSEFDTDLTDWSAATSSAPSTVVWSNGVALWQTDNASAARFRRSIPTVAGKTYVIMVSAASGTGTHGFALGTVQGGIDVLANQNFYGPTSFTFVALSNTTWIGFFSALNGRTLDYVSIREVLTNQPVQPVTLNELLSVSSGAKTVVANDNTLKTIPANYPAFDYSSGKRALRFEGATTNLALRSQDLSNAAWNNRTGAPSVTVNNPGAPDGTATFNLLQRNTTGTTYVGQSFTKAASSLTYTLSFYAKAGAVGRGVPVRIQSAYPSRVDTNFNLVTGAVGSSTAIGTGLTALSSSMRQTTPGVYYCTVTATLDASITAYAVFFGMKQDAASAAIDGTDTSSNADVYVWGIQWEQAAVASSYVATVASAVTRVTDVCAFSPLLNLCIPQMAATMAYRGNVKTTTASQTVIGLAGFPFIRGSGAGAAFSMDGNTSGITLLVDNTLPGAVGGAFGWDTSGRALAVNGSAVVTDTRVVDRQAPPFFFGGQSGATTGAVHELGTFVVWPLKASNSNLQQQARVYA
ncbi:phage head spike fiber domain-containing protein [Xanthobacter flavus]|uniref:phage head spike fiber domain-containing protein n=1 Tax=Xanthobacter flavus TaxID=281 RepID=UPI00372BDDFE